LFPIFGAGITKEKEQSLGQVSKGMKRTRKGKQRESMKGWINNCNRRIFQVTSCMHDFLAEV